MNIAWYRLICSHLFASDSREALRAWEDSLEAYRGIVALDGNSDDTAAVFNRERIAKTRLVMGGPQDKDLQLAIALAKANFQNERAMSLQHNYWFVQGQGIATYREAETDDALEQAVEELNRAVELFRGASSESHKRGISLCRFFSAMAHARLGDTEAAERDYLDGLDYQYWNRDVMRASISATWSDWQLAEVARREAQAMLGIEPESIDLPVPKDTSEWTVLVEDDFDAGIDDRWQRLAGDWKVVDGAACGTLQRTHGNDEDAYGRLEFDLPDSSTTCQIEYEVETSHPMLASCFLRAPIENPQPLGHRVALCSFPDGWLTNQGFPGTGVSLLTSDDFGFWFNQSIPDFQIEPGHRYQVRILRQPQRLTVFIDEEQVISQRVRNIETRSIRLFARGEEGIQMFVDNVRITVPPTNSESNVEDQK